MADAPRPVRISFADVARGTRAGYWYLRPRDDGGFRISWFVPASGDNHEACDCETAEATVALLADKFNLVFARHWANYQELVTLTREGKNAFDRPGFRPGYARRETKKGLDRFCRTFEANEKAMPQIQKGLVDAGWPPMTTLKIPWVLG